MKINQVVWTKIKGYPWWPAIIAKVPKNEEDFYRVNFFGQQTHALVVRKDLCKYEDKYEEFSDKKNKKLLNSITKADAYLEKQVLNKVIKQQIDKNGNNMLKQESSNNLNGSNRKNNISNNNSGNSNYENSKNNVQVASTLFNINKRQPRMHKNKKIMNYQQQYQELYYHSSYNKTNKQQSQYSQTPGIQNRTVGKQKEMSKMDIQNGGIEQSSQLIVGGSVVNLDQQQEELQVDLKKINNIQINMKDIIKSYIDNQGKQFQTLNQYFKKFNLNILNNQQLTKTKIPNIIKFLIIHLKSRISQSQNQQQLQLISLLQALHLQLQNKIISWLTNTQYYQKFISLQSQQPEQLQQQIHSSQNRKHKQAKSCKTTTNNQDFQQQYIQKLKNLLKKVYHLKKQIANRISQKIAQQVHDEPLKRKRHILKILKKKKTVDLKVLKKDYGDGMTNDEIRRIVQIILNQ